MNLILKAQISKNSLLDHFHVSDVAMHLNFTLTFLYLMKMIPISVKYYALHIQRPTKFLLTWVS